MYPNPCYTSLLIKSKESKAVSDKKWIAEQIARAALLTLFVVSSLIGLSVFVIQEYSSLFYLIGAINMSLFVALFAVSLLLVRLYEGKSYSELATDYKRYLVVFSVLLVLGIAKGMWFIVLPLTLAPLSVYIWCRVRG